MVVVPVFQRHQSLNRSCVFPQHHREAGAFICNQEVPGCTEDSQPDSLSAGPPQTDPGQRGPHHPAAQLLHQAEGQLQAGRVHQGHFLQEALLDLLIMTFIKHKL